MEEFYGGERGIDDNIMKEAGQNRAFSITSGADEKFALTRLLSRLEDMKSEKYWGDVLRRLNR